MKKSKLLAWGGALFALCIAFASCKGDDEKDDGGNVAPPQEEQTSEPGTMKYAKFYGLVTRKMYNEWGEPATFEGVKVTSGDQTTTTDANGYYQFESVKVVGGRAVLKFEKKGFMTVVRSVPMQDGMRMDVTMVQADSQEGFETSNGAVIRLNSFDHTSYMEVELPADGFVKENGSPYNGIVWPTFVYLDPDDNTFATQMPGNLSAVRQDQSAAQLISYGMFGLELRTGSEGTGEKVNLASGQTAFVKFPVPDMFKGQPLPPTIPLWSFNEDTGLWEEEGEASLDGEWYYGEVSHFSWHNLDAPSLRATINVTVKDSSGKPIVGVPVDIGGQRQYFTDKNGKLKCDIPSDCDVYVSVPSKYYGNYAEGDPSKEASTTVNLAGEETRDITLTIPVACSLITGKVTNTGAGSNVCTLTLSYFKEGWGWLQAGTVISDISGQFILYGPSGVTGPAMLTASFNDGASFEHHFELTGADQVVNFSVSSSSTIGAGVVTVTNEALGIKATYFLPAPKNGDYWAAASINGSRFMAGITTQEKAEINWEKGETVDMIDFIVDDYDPSKTNFAKGEFFWFKEGGPHLRIEAGPSPASITKNGDVYTFKMVDGDGKLEDQMKNYNDVRVKVSVEMSVKEGQMISFNNWQE